MTDQWVFPFGIPVQRVTHKPDCTPKRVFVVGVYSSAVHARWIGPDGEIRAGALAVANEPEIFWPGGDATGLIPVIDKKFGRLQPAGPANNGPSGRALNDRYLAPLGLTRGEVWLTDMVPHTLSNDGQQNVIRDHYDPLVSNCGLPQSNVPLKPATAHGWRELVGAELQRLLEEARQSGADTIISLGNAVIDYFFNHQQCRLGLPPLTRENYGIPIDASINGRRYRIFRLAHPRVTSIIPLAEWQTAHDQWIAGSPKL
jgi:hypothetical protein